MPEPLKDIDRDLVRTLVLQGLKSDEIVRQTGVKPNTLRTWILRGGWNKSVAKASTIREAIVSERIEQPGTIRSDAVQEASAIVRERFSAEILATTADLIAMKRPKSIVGHSERIAVWKSVMDIAKTCYGWAENAVTSVINIALLESMRPVEPVRTVPAIDVQSQPVGVEAVKHACDGPEQAG